MRGGGSGLRAGVQGLKIPICGESFQTRTGLACCQGTYIKLSDNGDVVDSPLHKE